MTSHRWTGVVLLIDMKRFGILLLLTFSCCLSNAADRKPNFVVFLVDDLGWGDLGCYGSTFHETPHLDRLAADGMKFTQAYSACTVCSPSRAAIMTGRYPGRLHLTDWITGHKRANPKLRIPDWKMKMGHELTTLPEALKEAGYRTEFVGKWHLMPIGAKDFDEHYPDSHGFDINIAGREWGQPKGPGKYFSPFGMPNLDNGKKGDFLTDRLTDEAVKFIEQSKDNPFLLYFSYYTVHGPIMTKPELLEKYKTKAAKFENTRNERVHPAYAGMIESLDDSIGRVLGKLDSLGLSKDTIVIFTADNGGTSQQSSGGLRGQKALAYEGGTREPLLVKWPERIPAGSISDVPAIGTDLYPTMLELAGEPAKPKAHLDGLSLAKILTGKATSVTREALYWHYPHYHRTLPYGAVRKGDWKLIEFFEDNRLELYNLKTDPAESQDLSSAKPGLTAALLANLKQWRTDVNAQMPTPNPDYDPNYVAPKRSRRRNSNRPISTPLGEVTASSAQEGNPPAAALDGKPGTRWAASDGSVPQTWQLKFSEPRKLNGVRIHWKNNTWYNHTVEVSVDGKKWKQVGELNDSKTIKRPSIHRFSENVRHLRVTVTKLGSGWATFTELEPLF